MICNACPRGCNVDREVSLGYCKSPEKFKLARASLHYWEEPCISGKNGSGAIFFSGCNLGCVFCQNYEISHGCKGVEVSDDDLVRIMKRLVDEGANNINFVNPTHYSLQLLRVLEKYKPPVPIVYNTSGYDSVETLKMLDGAVDIYLPDFKYIRPEKALKYSKAEDYPQVAKEALAEMKRQVSEDVFDENGIMKSGVIIRHMVLPSHRRDSEEILRRFAEMYPPKSFLLSLMSQYTPFYKSWEHKEINRRISTYEYERVADIAAELGFEGYMQERSSAKEEYTPDFDLSGV